MFLNFKIAPLTEEDSPKTKVTLGIILSISFCRHNISFSFLVTVFFLFSFKPELDFSKESLILSINLLEWNKILSQILKADSWLRAPAEVGVTEAALVSVFLLVWLVKMVLQ